MKGLLLILLWPVCFAARKLYYPPLYWHKDDCRFQSLQRSEDSNSTKEVFMKVIYSNDGRGYPYGLTVVCPTVHMNNWMDVNPDPFSFNENMWQVDKEGYDKCEVNSKGNPKENRLVLTCNDKMKIKKHNFYFMQIWGFEDQFTPVFEEKKHYFFISTSNGDEQGLKTRKVSGKDGSCEKYHMKLHIYVCSDDEDCVYELPKCGPPAELYRDMRLVDGKLRLPTRRPPPKTVKKIPTTLKTKEMNRQVTKPTTPWEEEEEEEEEEKEAICREEDKGTSIHLILNFVLGGVALFMAVVIIILVCGLSDKRKTYEMERPPSAISTTHGGHIVNAELVNAEMVRYSDGHVQLSPVILSRTPPTSPSIIIPAYPTLQRVHSQRESAPSDIPSGCTPPGQFRLKDPPSGRSRIETPLSNDSEAFTFPEQAKSMDSETNSEDHESSESSPTTNSDDPESSESGLTTTAIITNPRDDDNVET